MIWILIPLVLLSTLAAVFFPLLRKAPVAMPKGGSEEDPREALSRRRDMILRQLKELEYEEAAGLVGASEAAAAGRDLEQELGEVLLRLDTLQERVAVASAPQQENHTINLLAGMLVMLVITSASLGLYVARGTPTPPAQEEAARQDGSPPHDMAVAAEGLAERLKGEPDNLEGWMQLGRTYAVLGETHKAIAAFKHILERDKDNEDVAVVMGETMLQSGDPQLIALGFELFQGVHERNPERAEGLWFTGMAAFRSGDRDTAMARWLKLLSTLPPGSKPYETVKQAIAEAQGTP